MLVLAYDTETTGIIRGSDYTNPANPFLASIAMLLFDSDTNKIVSSFNAVVKPNDWTMPEEAGRVNGLTNEYLNAFGIPAEIIIPTIMAFATKADLLVAHNVEFDTKIIATALYRHLLNEVQPDTIEKNQEEMVAPVNFWLSLPTYCTMKESKTIVGATNKKGALKHPKLTEAYEFFFDKPLNRAHSANADAVAVLEIYLALQNYEK